MKQLLNLSQRLFRDLSIWNKLEFVLFILFFALLPFKYYIAPKYGYLLILWVAIKVIATKHIGNNALTQSAKRAILSLAIFGFLYIISFLWSNDPETGRYFIIYKKSFIVFPIIFLCSDLSYLTKDHIRALISVFLTSFILRFFYLSTIAICNSGCHLIEIMKFLQSHDHHTFISLYATFGLLFLFIERKHINKFLLIVSICSLLFYIYSVQSRAGEVFLYFFATLFFCHELIKKKYRNAIAIALLFIGYWGITTTTSKYLDITNRTSDSIAELYSDEKSDVRYLLWESATKTIIDIPCWKGIGVGVGDQHEELMNHTSTREERNSLKGLYHAHNQYLSTLVDVGILGALLLLFIFLYPMLMIWKSKNDYHPYLFFFLILIGVYCLIDGVFEFTMGSIFFCSFYCLFLIKT